MFLALRMIHRHPLALTGSTNTKGENPRFLAEHPQFNACKEIVKVLAHPQGHLLQPLPRPPPTTPPQAVRRLVNLRHLQHRLNVH